MHAHLFTAIVTLLTGILCFWMSIEVSRARKTAGVFAPAMTGDPRLERTIRAHYNTLEWMPVVLPALWLFAIYWDSTIAAGLGLIWIIGRIVYFKGYTADAKKRGPGFAIQFVAAAALLLGALGRVVWLAVM